MYDNIRLKRYVLLMGLCAGVAGMVFLQYASAQYAMDEKPAMKTDSVLSPIMQISHGVAPEKVQCRDGMQLVFKSSNNMPACVKPTSVQRLMQIGWAKSSDMMTIPSSSAYTLDLNAVEEDEKYLWTNSDGNNPDLTLVVNAENVIQIKNPTDAKHELVIEADGTELAASGDIDGDGTGKLSITPTMTGTFEYHCEYHPSTMKGTIHIVHS